jgi:hypothetical protein
MPTQAHVATIYYQKSLNVGLSRNRSVGGSYVPGSFRLEELRAGFGEGTTVLVWTGLRCCFYKSSRSLEVGP